MTDRFCRHGHGGRSPSDGRRHKPGAKPKSKAGIQRGLHAVEAFLSGLGADKRKKMCDRRPFRIGITPDFVAQSQRLLDPALAEVLGPRPGIECEVMPDTAGLALPDVLDRYDAVVVLDYRFTTE